MVIAKIQYTMMKLPIREIIKQEYDVKIDKNEANIIYLAYTKAQPTNLRQR